MSISPFKSIASFAKSRKNRKKDVLKDVRGVQTREMVYNIVYSVIRERRSIRRYQHRNVNDDIINRILDAARYAPSEGNSQPWEFIVVRNNDMKRQLVECAYGQTWMLDAPVFIVACINMKISKAIYGERGEKLYGIQSVAASIENMMIEAQALGLGTCWVGSFSEARVAVLLKCPDYVRPCAIITVGWPDEKPRLPVLQELKNVIHHEEFGQTPMHRRAVEERKPLYIKMR